MFVYSIRSSTVKLVGVLLVALIAMSAIFIGGDTAVSASSNVSGIDYSGIETGYPEEV